MRNIRFLLMMTTTALIMSSCMKPKHIYEEKNNTILTKLYQNEKGSRKKAALEYVLKAKQSLNLEQYAQAEQILFQALETNEYKNFVQYYMAKTQFHLKRYGNVMQIINGRHLKFKKYPGYRYNVLKLKADTLYALDARKEALNAYKKCLNMHSKDEYVKQRIDALKSVSY